MPTPHIECNRGDIAKTVILTSDPVLADRIARARLEGLRKVNGVRNMLGYTGTVNGKTVSVMGTGIGIPSTSIYTHELFSVYGVTAAIRINTCSALSNKVKPGDILLATGASTTSNINRLVFPGTFCPTADFRLLYDIARVLNGLGSTKLQIGGLLTCDTLDKGNLPSDKWAEYGMLAADLETAGFYTSALRNGARAAAISIVEDDINGENQASAEQQNEAIELASLASVLVASAITQ